MLFVYVQVSSSERLRRCLCADKVGSQHWLIIGTAFMRAIAYIAQNLAKGYDNYIVLMLYNRILLLLSNHFYYIIMFISSPMLSRCRESPFADILLVFPYFFMFFIYTRIVITWASVCHFKGSGLSTQVLVSRS